MKLAGSCREMSKSARCPAAGSLQKYDGWEQRDFAEHSTCNRKTSRATKQPTAHELEKKTGHGNRQYHLRSAKSIDQPFYQAVHRRMLVFLIPTDISWIVENGREKLRKPMRFRRLSTSLALPKLTLLKKLQTSLHPWLYTFQNSTHSLWWDSDLASEGRMYHVFMFRCFPL